MKPIFGKVSLLIIAISGIFTIHSSAEAKGPDPACLDHISRGYNQFRTKVSRVGLERLAHIVSSQPRGLKTGQIGMLIDYSLNSNQKRAFLVDFHSCDLRAAEYVIHGGTVYTPVLKRYGDINADGFLDKCLNDKGTRENMTRPGGYLTAGCHQSQFAWPILSNGCKGIKLRGLERQNADAMKAGVVMHEHDSVYNSPMQQLEGQGCPAFSRQRLSAMGLEHMMDGMAVYMYVPQCE